MTPSSSGSRNPSRAAGGNSPSSSRKSTPPWLRLISPGRSVAEPPPMSPTVEVVWCGRAERRRRDQAARRHRQPGGRVNHRHRQRLGRGRAAEAGPASRWASIVFPDPGEPTISRWCPPAAAISSARRATGWPRTSARSGGGGGSAGEQRPRIVGPRRLAEQRLDDLGQRGCGAHLRHPSRRAPRRRPRPARRHRDRRARRPSGRPRAPAAACRRGRARRRTPGRRRAASGTWPDATRTPMAIARSSPAPTLRVPDGARLTVMHWFGPLEVGAHHGGADAVA